MRTISTFSIIVLSGIAVIITASSCKTTVVLAIPTKFSEQATKMEVSGSRKRYVSFGNYKTSTIKRGWTTRSQHGRYDNTFESSFMRVFGIDRHNEITKENAKFHFSINNGNHVMDVMARERRINVDRNTQIGNGIGILKNFSKTLQYEYSFNALIFDNDHTNDEPWRLVLGNEYDYRTDTSRGLFHYPKDEDHGYVTNGKDSIIIKEIRTNKTQGRDGKDVELPFRLRTGYELRMDGGVSAILDLVKKDIWFYNELDEHDKLLLAAISTAIMVRRVKDAQW